MKSNLKIFVLTTLAVVAGMVVYTKINEKKSTQA